MVQGDLSATELFIEVVPPGTPMFVTDVDGTLTTSENEEAYDFLVDNLPDANPSAPEALSLLASKGYRPMYITARPEWLKWPSSHFHSVGAITAKPTTASSVKAMPSSSGSAHKRSRRGDRSSIPSPVRAA